MTDLVNALEQRGFIVRSFQTGSEARDFLLASISPAQSVGIGGSMTIREIGAAEALRERGNTVYWHWDTPGAQTRLAAHGADVYLCSCNAITRDGQLVYIDGTGNRVGALIAGPTEAYVVASLSKAVDGGLNTAIARTKRESCPRNARRLKLDTPCGKTGLCKPEACGEDCMCRTIVALSRPGRGRKLTVVLVEEPLGY